MDESRRARWILVDDTRSVQIQRIIGHQTGRIDERKWRLGTNSSYNVHLTYLIHLHVRRSWVVSKACS